MLLLISGVLLNSGPLIIIYLIATLLITAAIIGLRYQNDTDPDRSIRRFKAAAWTYGGFLVFGFILLLIAAVDRLGEMRYFGW
jgi:hypothetical protein